MIERRYQLTPNVTIVFTVRPGSLGDDDVTIRKGGTNLMLTPDEWDELVQRTPYIRLLAERYP